MTSQKHILVATGIYPPSIGGPATYSKLLADELPKRGFKVTVETFDSVRQYPKIISHVIYFFRLLRRGAKVDIIYAQDPVSVGAPAHAAAKVLGKRFLLKVVGDYAWEQGTQRFGVRDNLDLFSLKYLEYRWPVQIMKRIEFHVARTAERVIVPSEYLKQVVSNWGVLPEKIKVIYNAYTPFEIPESKEELRKTLGLSGKVVISVGRLVPWKGFDVLISLMPEVLKTYPEAKLLIIGSGPLEKELRLQIADLGIDKNVQVLGQVEHALVLKYLKAADVFALNTSYEGFSHLVLEVMSVGTPIVTTPVGGNSEVLRDRENALLVAPNDTPAITAAILELLGEKELSVNIAARARETLASFTEEKMIDELLKLL